MHYSTDKPKGQKFCINLTMCCIYGWLRGPTVEHWSLANVLSLSCARLVADG